MSQENNFESDQHEAYSWMKEKESSQAESRGTEFKDNELEKELKEVADRFQEDIESTKAEIEKFGGEEALEEEMKKNPEFKAKMLDAYDRIIASLEGLALVSVGGAITYGAALTNIFEKINSAGKLENPSFVKFSIGSIGLVVLLKGCEDLVSGIKGKFTF